MPWTTHMFSGHYQFIRKRVRQQPKLPYKVAQRRSIIVVKRLDYELLGFKHPGQAPQVRLLLVISHQSTEREATDTLHVDRPHQGLRPFQLRLQVEWTRWVWRI